MRAAEADRALAGSAKLLNVSCDPTGELYTDSNKAFPAFRKSTAGEDLKVGQSNGGSSKQGRIGDVAISWENEALLAVKQLGKDKARIVAPSVSVLAEPPLAVVESVYNSPVGSHETFRSLADPASARSASAARIEEGPPQQGRQRQSRGPGIGIR